MRGFIGSSVNPYEGVQDSGTAVLLNIEFNNEGAAGDVSPNGKNGKDNVNNNKNNNNNNKKKKKKEKEGGGGEKQGKFNNNNNNINNKKKEPK